MRTFLIVMVGCLAVACDGTGDGFTGEPDRSGYTPEDYVPDDYDLADYDTEAKRVCLLYNAVTRTRFTDCDPETMMSMAALSTCTSRDDAPEDWAWQAGCLDHMATATCADLEGPGGGRVLNDGCYLVESWEEWRTRS